MGVVEFFFFAALVGVDVVNEQEFYQEQTVAATCVEAEAGAYVAFNVERCQEA